MKSLRTQNGMTLIEVVVTFSIVTVILIVATTFLTDTFSFNRRISDTLEITGDARRALKTMISEIRITSPSSLGAYPLSQTATSSFVFYGNVDDDAHKERVRYFREGTTLKRGVVNPTGNPLVYDLNTEVVAQIAKNVVNEKTVPIFSYYDSTYSGTGSALSGAFDISTVRLVKIDLVIDSSGTSTATSDIFTSQISMRNLKDNL
jgi:type II secretory pathway pseudopilin PulG